MTSASSLSPVNIKVLRTENEFSFSSIRGIDPGDGNLARSRWRSSLVTASSPGAGGVSPSTSLATRTILEYLLLPADSHVVMFEQPRNLRAFSRAEAWIDVSFE